MLQSGLFMQAARCHTRSCVNLCWNDILLHQQVGQSHFHHILSALQRVCSVDHPPRQRSTIPQQAGCGEAPACCHLQQPPPELHASRAMFGVTVARPTSATVCHARSSATRPEQLVLCAAWDQSARVGLTLARGTFTAAILHTKWDLTGHTRRPSKRFPPRLTAVPADDQSPPALSPLRKHWLLSTKGRGWGTVVKVLG